MKLIEVFDQALCCPTGVCGPSVDPALARFAADLDWLSGQGVSVERFNLAQQPGAFVERPLVAAALREQGEDCLPLVLADGEIVSRGERPSRDELATLAIIDRPKSLYSPAVESLVAVAASVASHCESGLKYHLGMARQLGVAEDDIAGAVDTARSLMDIPARKILQLADELLDLGTESRPSGAKPVLPLQREPATEAACCSPAPATDDAAASAAPSTGCC